MLAPGHLEPHRGDGMASAVSAECQHHGDSRQEVRVESRDEDLGPGEGVRDLARAGIPRRRGVQLHVMRHSACSALALLGAPTIAIQALAGHESTQTTAKYMHLAPGVQAAAVRLFDESRGKDVASLDASDEK
jgi:hypothetical protein